MFARVYSGALAGVDAYRVEVEVDCCGGIGQVNIVGLPGAAVKESQERVRSAIKSCDYLLPPAKKWVVNLAPADTRKEGPAYDMPIAAGMLASIGYIPAHNLSKIWMVGELSLNGNVRPVSGVLSMTICAREMGAEGIIVPEDNGAEAALVEGIKVYPVSHLQEALNVLERPENGKVFWGTTKHRYKSMVSDVVSDLDFRDVKGQSLAKTALMIAAAGRHNLLMIGPPGSGKSMLAERLPGIMPPLEYEEAVELTKLYSVAREVNKANALVVNRPFRAPHHSASIMGLVGGGAVPRPGEISLSHYGILFMDEFTEFPRTHLDSLRQPLETSKVTISRAMQTLTFPAAFVLIAACNPCPCGYKNDTVQSCICTPGQAMRYWSKVSGPILDRIDMRVEVKRLSQNDMLVQPAMHERTKWMRETVQAAIERQRNRNIFDGKFVYNANLNHRQMEKVCAMPADLKSYLVSSAHKFAFSVRAYDRVIRMSRTIADLKGHDEIEKLDVCEALGYRTQNFGI
ncbi:MAG: YifB family Mg chelatase-like AAA ATPase [Cyanobacteria bacterium TGS_CYA1]|nr:YifB family Mg chelatase-like AAA ATPase [Cyanobacteria bacterium TGS_CYA1]